MRVGILGIVGLTACGFSGHGGNDVIDARAIDAPRPIDAPDDPPAIDGMPDAPDAMITGICNGKRWATDFSSDPTMLDVNNDGMKDFNLRDGTTFDTGQLAGGAWVLNGSYKALDTHPLQSFATRTITRARMRTTTNNAGAGAVMWINVGYHVDHTFAPVWIEILKNNANSQTAYMKTKMPNGTESILSSTALGSGFVDVTFDVDPTTLTVTYTIAEGGTSQSTSGTLFRQTSGTTPEDAFATVVASSTSAEFDSFSVEACP